MPAAMTIAVAGSLWLGVWGLYALDSARAKETRAARNGAALALAGATMSVLALWLPAGGRDVAAAAILLACAAAAAAFLLPVGRIEPGRDVPTVRFDERDIMFSRARLEPGTPDYEAYYEAHPDRRRRDDRIRANPGLLSPRSRLAEPVPFAAAEGGFGLTEALREAVDGPVAAAQEQLGARRATALVKGLALNFGALDVGVTSLEPYHLYSHVGRGTGGYGRPIVSRHRYAVAFTVEMSPALVLSAPAAPTVMESARQYVEAARIAVQLAGTIRALGWPARAHIDGNYQVIAPLVARDAGLGEIGRMGLIMTPRSGPRVRLGVVTTELELEPDTRTAGTAVIDYCTACRKCIDNCPPRAIPEGPRAEIEGCLRWRIDWESCFAYWTVIGTDCARCMAVCPYSHPSAPSHGLVRWAVSRSGAARRVAIRLDDHFYGKSPPPKEPPGWIRG